MGNFFHSPRKVTGQNLDKFKVPCKCDRSDYKYQPVTAEGELTLEGVYEQFLLDMQNDRHWAKSTCIAYDREFWRSVAPIFRGIPYADLNEELAEKLWMERGQFGLGDRIIEQNAKNIFSCIVEQAYQHDLSQMRFWGNVDVELCKNGLARTAEGQKHLFNLAHKLLKRPKSLPISVVIRIYEEMVSRADRFGECVALLAMLLLGLRTSEAAGLSYGDIRQIDEELYAIERRYVEKQSSRDVQVGGKTSNSYRLLPLVKEFHDFLMERRQKALTYYHKHGGTSDAEVDKWPLGCQGQVYWKRCTTREMNQMFKNICCDAGVEEDFFEEADALLTVDETYGKEYEQSVTAYILRHQAATEYDTTDASRDEISALMGHTQENDGTEAFDFANADGQRRLLRIMMQRPIYMYICGQTGIEQDALKKGMSKVYDGPVELTVAENAEYELYAEPIEPNDTLRVEIEGKAELLTKQTITHTYSSFKRPRELGCTAVMREETRLAADMAEKSYTSVSLFENPKLVDSMPETEDLEREWLPEVVDAEGNPFPCSQQDESSKKKSKQEEKEGICEEELLAVLSSGRLVKVSENRWICKSGVCSLGLDKKLQVKRIVVFRQSVDKILVSPNGQAWYLPASLTVDDFCKDGRWQKCHEALLKNGVLTECNPKDTSLVCAAQSGSQVRLPLDQVRIISDGMQIVRTGGEKIVAACCSTAEEELLFVSRQGKALRVPVQAMHEYKNLGIGLVSGMKLKTGDSLCQLMVYRPEHKLIIVTEKGRGLVLSPDTAEKRMIEPKLGLSEGVQLIQWGHGGDVIDALYVETGVLLVTKQGKAHCHDLSEATPQNRGTMGHWWVTNHDVVGAVEVSIVKRKAIEV